MGKTLKIGGAIVFAVILVVAGVVIAMPKEQGLKPPEHGSYIGPSGPIVEVAIHKAGITTPPFPVTFHYGPERQETFLSIIGNTTKDFCPLSLPLYEDSLSSIQTISVHFTDKVKVLEVDTEIQAYATSYDSATHTVWVDGLKPNTTRSIVITYADTLPQTFVATVEPPASLREGYDPTPTYMSYWVTLDGQLGREEFQMMPFETKDIMVSLSIPANADVPQKFQFAIGIKPKQGETLSGITQIKNLQSRWLVTMPETATVY